MKKLIYNLILPFAFVAILLWSVIVVSQDRGFFDDQYTKNGTAEYIGIRQQDLMSVTDSLLSYMIKQRDSLDMQFEVKGEMREIFDEREKLHMVDVQNLYMGVVYIAAAITVLVAAGLFYLLKTDGWNLARKTLRRKYVFSAAGLLAAVGVLGFMIATNFQTFWYNFHLIFFTNDLWLLDPDVSIMINMFPLEFFFAICTKILINFVLWCIVVRIALADWTKSPKWLKSKRQYRDII